MNNVTSFNSDRPINSADQDRLGRAGFAHAIADRITAWSEKDSLVVALYGGWGSGKSSVKNMMREHLLRQEREKPDNNAIPMIVEFCPWEFSGSNQLCEEFFGTLAEAFRKLPKKGKTAADRLERYSKLLTFGSNLAAAIKIVAAPMAPPVAAIAGAASVGLQTAASIAKSGNELLRAPKQSLSAIKGRLREDFENLKRKFLVIIDDIDRLTSEEICLLIRLVKANSDFPNLIFLLLMQRETVEKALDRIVENKGALFLEKIVQVPFDVPQPRIGQIHQYVTEKVCGIFSRMAGGPEWDKHREKWNSAWNEALRLYFENFRVAHRYVNTLEFTAGAFKTPIAYQVNPVDLAVIEVFRLFEPALFRSLHLNKKRLTDERRTFLKAELENEVNQHSGKDIIKEMTGGQARIPQEKLGRILADLFPVLDGKTFDHSGQTWMREQRIAASYFFDRYFQLELPPGQVSKEDIVSFIGKSEDYNALSGLLNKWKNEGMLEDALILLDAEDFIQKVPEPAIVIGSILDNLEYYITTGLPHCETNDVSRYAAFWLKSALFNIPDAPQRDSLVLKILETAKPNVVMGLLWILHFIGKGAEKLITPEAISTLAGMIANRIQKCVEQNELFDHPKYVAIYWRWFLFDKDNAQNWAKQALLEQGHGAKILLLFAAARSDESGLHQLESDTENETEKRFDFQRMAQLAPLPSWESALAEIDTALLNEEERTVLQRFLKTMEHGRRNDSAGN